MKYENDDNSKLSHARKLFEDAVDHTANAHVEAHRAERFYHNTECEGQWESEDLEYLRGQERPAFSFNLIKAKVNTFLGMYADAERTPTVAAAGGQPSDTLMSDVINAVKDQILNDAKYEGLKGRQLKTGSVAGECSLHIEIEPDPEGEGWVKVNLYRILPFELHWDIASVEPDRSDARYLFWDRWLSKEEFKEAYPEKADEWGVISKAGESYSGITDLEGFGEYSSDEWGTTDDYDQGRHHRYYYDRRKNKVRVVRYEYVTYATKYYAVDGETGQKTEIEEGTRKRVEMAAAMGVDISILEKRVEVVEVCEFAGMTLLEEFDSAGPFDGFSIVPYCYEVDEETGTAYGFCRDLFDPQMEFNKGKSLEIEYLAQGTAPGVMAEQDTIPDEEAFSQQLRQPGGIAVTKKGAITENRVRDRVPTAPSAAVMARTQSAMDLLSEISAIPSSSNLTAAEHMQSGVTVAIKYNKTKQAVSTPFSNHEEAQRALIEKVVQVITRAMPDDQIESILQTDGKYVIRDGQVAEMMPMPPEQQAQMQQQQQGQQGMMPGQQMMPEQMGMQGPMQMQQQPQEPQMVPKAVVSLRDIKSVKYNLDMDYTSENSTLRMMELDILLQIQMAGTPIDPNVLVERATNSRAVRERLKKYIEEQQKASADGLEAQNATLKEQNDGFIQIEAAKIQENTRHNTATEQIDMSDQQIKARLKHLEVWEKADENEKARMMDLAKFAVQQRQATEAQQYGA
jgi:hypothetical protein